MDRITQILGSYTSKDSVNTNLYTNIELSNSNKLLPPDSLNYVLDLNKQFNTERQSSPYYRVIGKINPVISNVLFNSTGQDSFEYFDNEIFTNTGIGNQHVPYTYKESISKYLKEIDGWFGYFNPVLVEKALCAYIDMEPKRQRFSFLPDITNNKVKNLELLLTYPYSSDTSHYIVNNGLLIIDKNTVFVGGKEMVAIAVPVRHNLIVGDTILLTGTSMDGVYDVKRIGLDDGSLTAYYFCIDILSTNLVLGSNSRFSKIYNGVVSQYYFRKFKKLKTRSGELEQDDYEIYNLAFSENIYTDTIYQYIFNEDIDISNLTDNLGRPLSQIYLSIIKTSSNGIFTKVMSGLEAPFIPELNNTNFNNYLINVPVIQKIHGVITNPTPTNIPIESNILVQDNDFYGDVVEYNETTIEEIILGDVYHRFNTLNRETTGSELTSGPRPEGYYYKAHHLTQIRNFSSYIETGNSNTTGIPSYAVKLSDGSYIWRDYLDIGTTDVKYGLINYPFLNGCNYLYSNNTFEVKRQDPFDFWNMYHSGFPSDSIGNLMINDFNINQSNNVC